MNEAQTGMFSEADDIGTLVMTIRTVGGLGAMSYTLTQNPDDVFALNASTGQLKTTKMVDRESLDEAALLAVKVRATSVDSGRSSEHVYTIVVGDANDQTPTFNNEEYFSLVKENLALGSPLNGLDIVAVDRDSVRYWQKPFIVISNSFDYLSIYSLKHFKSFLYSTIIDLFIDLLKIKHYLLNQKLKNITISLFNN